jgi:hypothetical protein
VDNPDFFSLPKATQSFHLEEFAWVEFKAPLDSVDLAAVHGAGFVQVDTQVRFRLGLRRLPEFSSTDGLQAVFANDELFQVTGDQMANFGAERFSFLPGADAARIRERYALWSASLIEDNPKHCVQIRDGSGVQGWFLAAERGGSIDLTLAMLHRNAGASGFLVYLSALRAYADRGARLGSAAFSITNTPVHNIYAALHARFVSTSGCWFWTHR